jgi:flavin-dependent dehydrogenase
MFYARSVPRHVAILGAGPAGASLAAYLARHRARGGAAEFEVTIFDGGVRPPLVVGESLVPAVVPFLRRLGVEEQVASFSTFKPGAIFRFGPEDMLAFRFDEVRGARTQYSYNTPRDRFDAVVRDAALAAGARLVPEHARVERASAGGERVVLSDSSLAAAGLARQPDFIVDAGGRNRQLARLLGLPVVEGERRDTALHAHLEGVTLINPNDIHTDRLEHGWSWRIPLPGRVSVGLVMDSAVLREFGSDVEEQFDGYLRHDPQLSDWGVTAKRISPVMKYTNYQLRHTRGVGPGWALVGDAFGFIDPVFSSGLLIALDGAWQLAQALIRGGDRALRRFEARNLKQLENWQRVVRYFYDGRLFTLFKIGEQMSTRWLGRLTDFHFRRHMPRVVTGEATTHPYSMGLLDFMVQHALLDLDPRERAVR